MSHAGLAVKRQPGTNSHYKDIVIKRQRIDVLVNDDVIVELKSLSKLPEVWTSQVLSYLDAMNLKRGLLINFERNKLIDGVKRISL